MAAAATGSLFIDSKFYRPDEMCRILIGRSWPGNPREAEAQRLLSLQSLRRMNRGYERMGAVFSTPDVFASQCPMSDEQLADDIDRCEHVLDALFEFPTPAPLLVLCLRHGIRSSVRNKVMHYLRSYFVGCARLHTEEEVAAVREALVAAGLRSLGEQDTPLHAAARSLDDKRLTEAVTAMALERGCQPSAFINSVSPLGSQSALAIVASLSYHPPTMSDQSLAVLLEKQQRCAVLLLDVFGADVEGGASRNKDEDENDGSHGNKEWGIEDNDGEGDEEDNDEEGDEEDNDEEGDKEDNDEEGDKEDNDEEGDEEGGSVVRSPLWWVCRGRNAGSVNTHPGMVSLLLSHGARVTDDVIYQLGCSPSTIDVRKPKQPRPDPRPGAQRRRECTRVILTQCRHPLKLPPAALEVTLLPGKTAHECDIDLAAALIQAGADPSLPYLAATGSADPFHRFLTKEVQWEAGSTSFLSRLIMRIMRRRTAQPEEPQWQQQRQLGGYMPSLVATIQKSSVGGQVRKRLCSPEGGIELVGELQSAMVEGDQDSAGIIALTEPLLTLGLPIDALGPDGNSLLAAAIATRMVDLAQWLLERGGSPHQLGSWIHHEWRADLTRGLKGPTLLQLLLLPPLAVMDDSSSWRSIDPAMLALSTRQMARLLLASGAVPWAEGEGGTDVLGGGIKLVQTVLLDMDVGEITSISHLLEGSEKQDKKRVEEPHYTTFLSHAAAVMSECCAVYPGNNWPGLAERVLVALHECPSLRDSHNSPKTPASLALIQADAAREPDPDMPAAVRQVALAMATAAAAMENMTYGKLRATAIPSLATEYQRLLCDILRDTRWHPRKHAIAAREAIREAGL